MRDRTRHDRPAASEGRHPAFCPAPDLFTGSPGAGRAPAPPLYDVDRLELGVVVTVTGRGSTEATFEAFHAANLHVYRDLRRLALRARRAGARRWSVYALFEILRWSHMQTTGADGFRLNNNFRPLYARLLMEREPELAGFFELRRRPSTENAAGAAERAE